MGNGKKQEWGEGVPNSTTTPPRKKINECKGISLLVRKTQGSTFHIPIITTVCLPLLVTFQMRLESMN